MEEDIKMLEEFINLSFLYGKLTFTKTQLYRYQKALEKLIKAYKELEEENKQLEAIKDEVIRRYNFESIPVSLVEEKIEELIKEGRHYNANKIEVLQELLEKRK